MNSLSLTPDTYAPSIDESGNYIDNIPIIINGLICPCGSRKEHSFDTNSKFKLHCKTNKHKSWLKFLNQNKSNYFLKFIQNKETIEEQQKIIARMEIQLQNNALTINYLTQQLVDKNTSSKNEQPLIDLLDT